MLYNERFLLHIFKETFNHSLCLVNIFMVLELRFIDPHGILIFSFILYSFAQHNGAYASQSSLQVSWLQTPMESQSKILLIVPSYIQIRCSLVYSVLLSQRNLWVSTGTTSFPWGLASSWSLILSQVKDSRITTQGWTLADATRLLIHC